MTSCRSLLVVVTPEFGGVLPRLQAPPGVRLRRAELPGVPGTAAVLLPGLVAATGPAGVVVLRASGGPRLGLQVPHGSALLDADRLVDELGWFGLDAVAVPPVDELMITLAGAGVAERVGLLSPADRPDLALRATQLVTDDLAASLPPVAPPRRRRPPPMLGTAVCRRVRAPRS